MRLLKPTKGLIGVDITSATVKLLELKQCNDNYQVESYAVRPLREGAVVERRIRDINDVANVLSRAVEHAKPSTRKAAVAVPASAAITKTLTFPASLSEDEIEERITAESDRHIPFPFSEVAFDFQCLGPAPFDEDQQQVVLVACRQQDVSQLTETLERAGLEPAAVDVETFAMERSLAELRRQLNVENDPTACVGLVDIGANMNAFHVVRGGQIVYSRDTVYGGRQLTDAIRDRYSMSNEEAGFAKKRGGLPDDYQDMVLNPFLETVVQQVGRSLQLYYTAARQHEVQHIVLAGGSSVIPGLAERIAEDSGMSVTIANPFQRMRVNKRLNIEALTNDAPAMLTAGGLAMRVGQ
ncbi:type IV pilus assembly protein PilM [Halomonas sp. M1]|uniref:type IV pilus assembly protein PilM n=1 Tax=Halomonas sp. M1 TaxID=3035470 RepID=UPI00248607F0|nr:MULTISPECIES: type IV pilus assembly protein PilM [unclassified Halomonas]MDP3534388.1 type IV pilus assembly protein PilM [Halomonas sp.]WFE71055.1 type IV pilus assembly protein PilM [Halomonas sp. M1]